MVYSLFQVYKPGERLLKLHSWWNSCTVKVIKGCGLQGTSGFPSASFYEKQSSLFFIYFFFCLIIVKYNESTGRMWQVILSYALLFYNKEPGVIFKYHEFTCIPLCDEQHTQEYEYAKCSFLCLFLQLIHCCQNVERSSWQFILQNKQFFYHLKCAVTYIPNWLFLYSAYPKHGEFCLGLLFIIN